MAPPRGVQWQVGRAVAPVGRFGRMGAGCLTPEVVSKPPLEPKLGVGENRLILEIPDVCLRLNGFSPP
jgi:hypothetical protein